MSTEIEEFRKSLVTAVQAELERHASAVVAQVDKLRDDAERGRAELRADLNQQIEALADTVKQVQSDAEASKQQVQAELAPQLSELTLAVEQAQSGAAEASSQLQVSLEQRIDESEARQTRRLEDSTAGLEGMVQEVARPMMADVNDAQLELSRKVDGLEENLRKFDEQAARMVTYFNDVSQQTEQRQDELSETLKADIATSIETIKKQVDENDSSARRFQNEITQSVSQKINDAEDRFNNRLLAAESRLKEESGQKIADIDAHVGRVSTGLDETMTVLNDRIAGLDDRFIEVGRRIDGVEESVKGIDQDELEELKTKMSTAAGEAMLVRIEMERLEKAVNERTDTLSVRMTEVETNVADATMDVSTAVQLERMEEIERALVELDPDKFVLKKESKRADKSDGATTNDEVSAGS